MIPLSLRDRLLGLRDALRSSARFQRFAAAFPLTRRVARRRAGVMFDLIAGFVYSQVLLACVQLKLFDRLAAGPVSAEDLAARLSLPLDSMRLLLDAAVALDLVQHRSRSRYGLGPLGAELRGNPSVTALVAHHAILYRDLSDPVALLRDGGGGGELAAYWAYARDRNAADLSGDSIAPYTELMAASQPMIANEVLHAVSFRDRSCLLDVGGGDGAFLAAVAARAPQLRCILFDLPAVAARAAARFEATGLSSRATAIGGSFLTDALPDGADIVSLVRVIHDHDDAEVMTLLRAIHRALPAGGQLLVAEPIAGVRGAEAIGDAYFAFYLKAMGSGKARTFAQLKHLLEAAGFGDIQLGAGPMPLVASIITAVKRQEVC
ncbi:MULTISPECIES: methyltransferase [Rhodopseudomonas]|uniref:Methyltransferase n=1 Tax=Rhodopseudomonas palustris TaxID=1076 RepID=A0A0D7ELQ0_RHOPL|nr:MULTISPECIES: methyltransferase [Rhodopseudomonas]KIZ41703.1 methyltransferase [Rhodopseudomonas palustris]WOK20400.1 methyltransferase [Rhodopseudomonas sp. BAL398]